MNEPTIEQLQDQLAETERVDAEILKAAIQQIGEGAHIHHWFIIGVWSPPKPAKHPLTVKWAETVALCRCLGCGLPETFALDGEWTLEQLRIQAEEAPSD